MTAKKDPIKPQRSEAEIKADKRAKALRDNLIKRKNLSKEQKNAQTTSQDPRKDNE